MGARFSWSIAIDLAPISKVSEAPSLLAQILGSVAVAAAFFMILEFSSPYSGLFRISPVGIDGLIKSMGG